MEIRVEKEKCDQCGTCISVCPADALTLTNVLLVDSVKCTRCSTCVRICPFGALSLRKEVEIKISNLQETP